MRKIDSIIIHCSATPAGRHVTAADIRKWHLARGFTDIGYHYIIYLDGSIHTGRPLSQTGAHCRGHNTGSIGICYVGGLDALGTSPADTRTDAQRRSLRSLVAQLLDTYSTRPPRICRKSMPMLRYSHRTVAARTPAQVST